MSGVEAMGHFICSSPGEKNQFLEVWSQGVCQDKTNSLEYHPDLPLMGLWLVARQLRDFQGCPVDPVRWLSPFSSDSTFSAALVYLCSHSPHPFLSHIAVYYPYLWDSCEASKNCFHKWCFTVFNETPQDDEVRDNSIVSSHKMLGQW